MISPFSSSSRERARNSPFYRLRLLFTLKTTVSLFYKAKQSAWRWSEESSIKTHEHDAGHSINETADHFIKHICLTFLDAFFGWLTNRPSSDRWQNGTKKSGRQRSLEIHKWEMRLIPFKAITSNLMRGRERRYHARDIALGQPRAHRYLYLIVLISI